MNMMDLVIIVVLGALLVSAVLRIVSNRKKGSGCHGGANCAECAKRRGGCRD